MWWLCVACMDQLGFLWSTDTKDCESMIHDAYKDAG